MKSRLLAIFVIFLISEGLVFCLSQYLKASGNVIASSMTAIAVIFGYFLTHYLEIYRKERAVRLDQYVSLVNGLRLLLLEEDLKGTDKQLELRDNLQKAYFSSSLLITKKSYNTFKETMGAFEKFLGSCPDKTARADFVKKQSSFINSLREEFFLNDEIDFETYDLRLRETPSKSIPSPANAPAD